MKGFQSPFDIDKKFYKSAVQSAVYIASGVAFRLLALDPKIALTIAATGVIVTGLVNFGYISDFETVSKEALIVRIQPLTKQNIRTTFHDSYAENARSNVKNALEQFNTEIERLKEKEKGLKTEHAANTELLGMFLEFDTKLSEVKTRLEDMILI